VPATLLPPLLAALVCVALAVLPEPAHAVAGTSTWVQPHRLDVGDAGESYETVQTVTLGVGGGAADVYPVTVDAPWFPRITDVDVHVNGFWHQNPEDLVLVLAEQGGPQVTLMAGAGGSTGAGNGPGQPISLTFDDQAAHPTPDQDQLVSGTYRPATYGTVPALPAPAPALDGNTSLSVFNGVPVSSTWHLYAFDRDGSAYAGGFGRVSLDIAGTTSPYPSELQVSGLGFVTDVDVTLDGFSSTYPDDLDLMLVGPTGRQVTLMSDVGGYGRPDHVQLTFDDEASQAIPDDPSTAIPSGTYLPSNTDEPSFPDVYPPPAPVSDGATSLSVFDGTDPNGTWRLFAVDDVAGDVTKVEGGWSLRIAYDDSAAPTGTVSVAAGAAATASRAVTLDLTASDPAPATGVSRMRFSNDATTYSAFQPYAATAPWTLSDGDGTKTVYAQFEDAAGNVSTAASDTIVLDTTGPRPKKFKPGRNDHVGPTAKVRVVATEALDPKTVTKVGIVLRHAGVRVKGKVGYVAARHKIVLQPRRPLAPGTYRVVVKTTVTDVLGNRFDAKPEPGLQRLTWTFLVRSSADHALDPPQAARSGSPLRRSFCRASRSSWRTRSAEMPCLAPMSASLCWRPSVRP
jgi:hypothetical protein